MSSSLSNSSFVVAVKNTGNRSVIIQSVFVAANGSQTQINEDDGGLNIGSSVLFAVLPNGTLVAYGSEKKTAWRTSATISQLIRRQSSPTGVRYLQTRPSTVAKATTTQLSLPQGAQPRVPTGARDDMYTSTTPLDFTGVTNSVFQIVPGQSYLVGAISGDVTSTLVIVAT